MDLQVSVKNQIIELQNYHLDIIQNNNGIIDKVLREISAISSRRRELNRKLVDHFAKVHISDTYGHCFRKHPDSDFGIIRTLISAHPDTLSKD